MEGKVIVMAGNVNYEYSLDSFVSIEVPAGSDPQSKKMLQQVRKKLIDHLNRGDFKFLLEKVYDPEGVMGQAESYHSPKKLNKNFFVED